MTESHEKEIEKPKLRIKSVTRIPNGFGYEEIVHYWGSKEAFCTYFESLVKMKIPTDFIQAINCEVRIEW